MVSRQAGPYRSGPSGQPGGVGPDPNSRQGYPAPVVPPGVHGPALHRRKQGHCRILALRWLDPASRSSTRGPSPMWITACCRGAGPGASPRRPPGELAHICFPIGVHPAGQVWARGAHGAGVGVLWAGAGNAMPTKAQLELIENIRPTVLVGMPSFALHMANIADAEGVDLRASSITRIITAAEALSDAKREKLSRDWGAEVYDVFGMSEAGLMGGEGHAHDGIHIWTDLYFIESVDEHTLEPLNDERPGMLLVTPLVTGHATPFLRWNSGDIVSLHDGGATGHRYADLFPMIRHAHRTAGFFKVRGINVNHTDFEDFIFADPKVNDFQVVLKTAESGVGGRSVAPGIEARRRRLGNRVGAPEPDSSGLRTGGGNRSAAQRRAGQGLREIHESAPLRRPAGVGAGLKPSPTAPSVPGSAGSADFRGRAGRRRRRNGRRRPGHTGPHRCRYPPGTSGRPRPGGRSRPDPSCRRRW